MTLHARCNRLSLSLCFLFLLCIFLSSNIVNAQGLSDAPDLSTITQAPGATDTATASSAKGTGKGTASDGDSTASATSSAAGFVHISGAPDIGAGIPPLIVPDTSDAPFMQKSNLPEGTVFICVGAVLGFLGAAVLAWRGLVAWSLHRSVKRAASRTYASETKSSYRGSSRSRLTSNYDASSMSLEHLASSKTAYDGGASGDERNRSRRQSRHRRRDSRSRSRHEPRREPRRESRRETRHESHGSRSNSRHAPRRTSRHVTPNSNANLFFSPTAANMQSAQQRASSYLPAGFYASGVSATAGGASIAHIGGPPAAGYMRMDNSNTPSPPISPSFPPDGQGRYRDSQTNPFLDRPRGSGMMNHANSSRGSLSVPHSRNPSGYVSNRSSVNLAANEEHQHQQQRQQRQQQPRRAPSAYLDDVLDTHGSAMSER